MRQFYPKMGNLRRKENFREWDARYHLGFSVQNCYGGTQVQLARRLFFYVTFCRKMQFQTDLNQLQLGIFFAGHMMNVPAILFREPVRDTIVSRFEKISPYAL
jgi:hypothetical protein